MFELSGRSFPCTAPQFVLCLVSNQEFSCIISANVGCGSDYDPETRDWAGATAHKRSALDEPLIDDAAMLESEAFKKAPVKRSLKAQPAMGEAYRGKKVSRADLGFEPSPAPSDGELDGSLSELSSQNDFGSELEQSDDDGVERMDEDSFEIDLGGELDSDEELSSDDEAARALRREKSRKAKEREEKRKQKQREEATEEADALERELLGDDLGGSDMDGEGNEQGSQEEHEYMDDDDEEEDARAQVERLKGDAESDEAKAKHALNQKVLWDAMLDIRLKLQGPHYDANRLPQPDTFKLFEHLNEEAVEQLKQQRPKDSANSRLGSHVGNGNGNYDDDDEGDYNSTPFETRLQSVTLSDKLASARSIVRDTLSDLVTLQQTLLKNNSPYSEGMEFVADNEASDSSPEEAHQRAQRRKRLRSEVLSAPDDEADSSSLFHTFDTKQLWEHLEAFQAPLLKYSEEVMDKWAQKALYAQDVSNKFKAMNQSISAQVDQIMSNREKVIQKTRVRRDEYHILGKNDQVAKAKISAVDAASGAAAALLQDNHDVEIFDDGDFSQNLLRELMEAGLQETSDPIEMTRRYLMLRTRQRSFKVRRERRPTKGRTLRFNEHAKLVAFMAPVPGRYPMHDAYVTSQLILSLFGQHPPSTNAEDANGDAQSQDDSEYSSEE